MERINTPFLLLGPTSSGKLSLARQWIETAHGGKIALPLETRTFNIGDGYEARVLASPYHFEIDIPNLSMQDKQIIGDLLTTFFASGDVLSSLRSSARKLVILRRAHSLSLPAAIRVRAILHQYVIPSEAAGMIWLTAREMTGPLALLEDAFVKHRVPRMPYLTWATQSFPTPLLTENAWDRCNGRPERVAEILKFFPSGELPHWPRRVQDFYDEMVLYLIRHARSGKEPNLTVVHWIRTHVYEALSLCQTGPEIIDSCATSVQRNRSMLEPQVFWQAMDALSYAEPHTSYRTPLSLEAAILNLYETIRQKSTPIVRSASDDSGHGSSMETLTHVGDDSAAISATAKPKGVRRRAAPRKKTTPA